MPTQVVMPKLSPTMEEGQVTRWLKKEGDPVSMGEPLAEIDTDKATMEMQALGSGVLRKILIGEGETAKLGQIIAVLGAPDEDIAAMVASVQAQPTGGGTAEKVAGSNEALATAESTPEVKLSGSERDDGRQSAGADGGGRSEVHLADRPGLRQDSGSDGNGDRQTQEGGSRSSDGSPSGNRLIVSPIAARMAAEAGIDLRGLTGSGPGGRIVKRDVEAARTQPRVEKARLSVGHAKPRGGAQLPSSHGPSPYREEAASVIRQTIARRLVTSLGPIPHFYLTVEIEMNNAYEMREAINRLEDGPKISVNDLIVKVTAAALIKHPEVNASFQEKTVRYYERADIGVAVAIEDGLITPVIRSADLKSIGEIATEIRELAERARARKLLPEEYTGATFSISNLGMFGIDEFTAVINPPEAAILAIGSIVSKPVVRDGEVIVRQVMRVTMSCDHRVIDGATGARFLQSFKKIMENPIYLVV